MHAKRSDDNQKTFALAIRTAGYEWHDYHMCGNGVPDGMICRAGRCEWVEVKASAKSALTHLESLFFSLCPGGRPILAWDPQQAIDEFERRGHGL